MLSHLLISIIADDKPGVVEALAETVNQHHGNWLESRLSQLGGKFAGVVRVAAAAEHISALEASLGSLNKHNMWVKTEPIDNAVPQKTGVEYAYVHVLGPDRPGIVRELSKALAESQINVANLETSLSSMPYSGEPLFDARGELEIPQGFDLGELHEELDAIANALALDISLSQTPFADS